MTYPVDFDMTEQYTTIGLGGVRTVELVYETGPLVAGMDPNLNKASIRFVKRRHHGGRKGGPHVACRL